VQKNQLQKRPAYLVTSVDNALRLLQLLRDEGRLQLTDAARELGVAPSTAHRLLSVLVYRGFAMQDEHHAYLPGPGMGNGPAGLSWARQLRDLAVPHLELLSERLDETVNLMVRAGTRVRFLLSIEASNVLRVGDRQGTVLPARLASGGKALLAELDETTLRRLYRGGGAELLGESDFGLLLDELALVRRTGYALNIEATETGIAAVGMVVIARRPSTMAAFSVSTPRARFRDLLENRSIELMFEVRRELEQDLQAAALTTYGK
jgi:IclR family transcriptional regulator, acetate operon repressor